jgi:Ca2+-binding RTX toxin-like protein
MHGFALLDQFVQDGDDRIDGGAGSDLISGGNGQDTADYSTRSENLDVSITRGGYDDGESNERDNVRSDMEAVLGGSGHDYIVGWHANDFISGGAGDDTVIGDRGYDTINGDDGDDDLSGDDGNDRMSGGRGDDFIDGGDDSNLLYGGSGNDFLDARNHKTNDGLDGGSGWDSANVDFWTGFFDSDDDSTSDVEDVDWFWV